MGRAAPQGAHRPSTASSTRPDTSISQSELSMRSRRSGRRARLMTKTWRRRERWVRGAGAREGGPPASDPRPAGWGHSPHQTPSWWDSLGAGTHELRPTWGAHPLWRKVHPTVSP